MINIVKKVPNFPDRNSFQFSNLINESPLIIRGGCSAWKASSLWSLDHFLTLDIDFDVSVSRYKQFGNQHPKSKVRMPLRELLLLFEKYQTSKTKDIQDLYLAGWHYNQDLPSLADDIDIPHLFDDNILPFVNDNIIKYDWSSIFIGHEDTETPNHTDSFYVAVWLALIVGRKSIRYVSSKHHKIMSDKVDLFDPNTANSLDKQGVSIYEAELESGDIAFHPSGWWHQVKNHTFNIAVSNNYVNQINYLPFMQQLLSKSVLPIMNRVLELDDTFDFSVNYIHSPHTTISMDSLNSSNFLKNQKMINEYFTSYVHRFELVCNSVENM